MIERAPWLGGLTLGLGLGLVAAGFELVELGITTQLPMTFLEGLELAAFDLLLVGGASAALGVQANTASELPLSQCQDSVARS